MCAGKSFGLAAARHALALYPLSRLHAHRVFDAETGTHMNMSRPVHSTVHTGSSTVLPLNATKKIENTVACYSLAAQTRPPVLTFERYAKATPRDCEIWHRATLTNYLIAGLTGRRLEIICATLQTGQIGKNSFVLSLRGVPTQ